MRSNLVVMPTPRLDNDLRIDSVSEPLHRQALIAELAVERLIGSVLPRLARLNERSVDILFGEPSEDRLGDELRSVIRSKYLRCAVNADELREHFDHSGRSNAACHIDRQTFTGVLIDHRQTLQLLPVGTGVKHEVVRPDPVLGCGRYRPRPRTGETAARSLLRHLKPYRRPYPVGAVGAHRQTTPLQENLNPSVPEAGKLSRELLHGGSDGFVLRRHPRAVAERDTDNSAQARRAEIPRLRA